MFAHYKCWKCGHEWKTWVKGGTLPLKHPHSDSCPKCGHEYFTWTNYETDFKRQ